MRIRSAKLGGTNPAKIVVTACEHAILGEGDTQSVGDRRRERDERSTAGEASPEGSATSACGSAPRLSAQAA